jgi:putative colanic acid biosynthesis acetyltransferase WcaF
LASQIIETEGSSAISADLPSGPEQPSLRVNLAEPDNSDYEIGRSRIVWALWHFIGSPVVHSNILPISWMKVTVLRLFGATIGRHVYVKPGLKVKFPWYLKVGDYCWIGENVWIDNLAPVTMGSHVCVSQLAYLCTGNHDWTSVNMKLFRRPIILRDGCWLGARSTICPGVTIGTGAVAAVGSVASRDIPPYEVWAGNPATYVRRRTISANTEQKVATNPPGISS